MRAYAVILPVLLLVAGCGGRNAGSSHKTTSPKPVSYEYPAPKAPAMISEREEIAAWMREHWWDALAERDSIDSRSLEQNFVNWLELTLDGDVPAGLQDIFIKAGGNLPKIDALVEKYLYDPNSDYRNEDLYGLWARKMASAPGTDALQREKYLREAELCSLNPAGSVATDFTCTDPRGRRMTLHGIRASFTVLVFSNPGCHACKEIVDAIKGTEVESWAKDGSVFILNVYVDEDLDAWRGQLASYPSYWHNTYDQSLVLNDDSIYHIRAIPSVYLLDAEKKVILKDAATPVLLNALYALHQ